MDDFTERAKMALHDMQGRVDASKIAMFEKAIARVEALEEDVKAILRREADANRRAMNHLRNLEAEKIKSANYAGFSNEWRKKCEALEARLAKADALADTCRELSQEAYGYERLYETTFHRDVHEKLDKALAAYREGIE